MSDYTFWDIRFYAGELEALAKFFNKGGNLAEHVAHLQWTIRTNSEPGTYGIAKDAEVELTNLTDAIQKIQHFRERA